MTNNGFIVIACNCWCILPCAGGFVKGPCVWLYWVTRVVESKAVLNLYLSSPSPFIKAFKLTEIARLWDDCESVWLTNGHRNQLKSRFCCILCSFLNDLTTGVRFECIKVEMDAATLKNFDYPSIFRARISEISRSQNKFLYSLSFFRMILINIDWENIIKWLVRCWTGSQWWQNLQYLWLFCGLVHSVARQPAKQMYKIKCTTIFAERRMIRIEISFWF